MFSGSYLPNQVEFLLKQIDMPSTSVLDKEKLISKGKAHYSEMITIEKPPTEKYMDIYYKNLSTNGVKFKQDILRLTEKINIEYNNDEVVVVSLARAGTPVGVLVHSFLSANHNRKSFHYSVSIIRDRGIDLNAIKYILSKHKDVNIVFIDGWTGKGVISDELNTSISKFNNENNTNINPNLYVVSDISGTAYWAATHEDYLIPSAILNSTVSGLISRSILNKDYINENDFHGCIYYKKLMEHDISQEFINYILNLKIENVPAKQVIDLSTLKTNSLNTIDKYIKQYDLSSRNYIKPGIGESTRVLLRRNPKEILVRDIHNVNIAHLLHLASEKQINVIEDKELMYNAVAIIEESD